MELTKKTAVFSLLGVLGFILFQAKSLFALTATPPEEQKPAPALSTKEIYQLAIKTINETPKFKGIDPIMLTTIAIIESSGQPEAIRQEPRIKDASIGLMQVLQKTANWLYSDMFYRKYLPDNLKNPKTSMYFATAFVDFLRKYRNTGRNEEFIVRSYNGGAGTFTTATKNYYNKYLNQKQQTINEV
jgi:soluble lytic murein transglycosylase-like protein